MKKRLLALLLTVTVAAIFIPMTASAVTILGIKSSSTGINSANFPDAAFREYILQNIDKDKNSVLSSAEAGSVETLTISGKGISSLKGIGYFYRLRTLNCEDNSIGELDLSRNTLLTQLNCSNNQMNSLDVSKNKELQYLYCYKNCLKELNVANNTGLMYLSCNNNYLDALDVTKNTKLLSLSCYSNPLGGLDVTENTQLKYLRCAADYLVEIDLSQNTQLTDLNCSYNFLTELNLSKNTKLTKLDCRENLLKSLDISDCTGLSGSSITADSGVEIITDKNASPAGTNQDSRAIYLGNTYLLSKYMNTELRNPKIDRPDFHDRETREKIIELVQSMKGQNSSRNTADDANKAEGNPDMLDTPVISSASNTEKGISLKWNAVKGAEKYRVFKQKDNGKWTSAGTSSANKATVPASKLESGKTYVFTVRCEDPDVEKRYVSDYDKTGYTITYIAAPKLLSAKASSKAGQVKVTWEASAGAAQYRVFYKEEGAEKWSKAKLTTETSQTVKKLESGKTYYFTVRCVNADASDYTSGYDRTGLSAVPN